MDWLIRGISEETRDAIKAEAHNNGLTVPELLEATFSKPQKSFGQTWKVNNVSRKQVKKLVGAAKQRGMPLGKYLEFLAEKDEDEAEAQAKLNKIKEIIG